MLHKTALALALACALPVLAAEDPLLSEARSVATAIPPKLLEVLADEIAKGGPESAIAVCREKAPAMAKAASEKSGWAIRRVSLKNRNPKAVPDAWEANVLADFDRRVAAGEKAATLEKGEADITTRCSELLARQRRATRITASRTPHAGSSAASPTAARAQP